MTKEKALELVMEEVSRAETKFPDWPEDVVYGAAIVAEEAGETLKAAVDIWRERGKFEELKKEIVHTVAMGMRFLLWFSED